MIKMEPSQRLLVLVVIQAAIFILYLYIRRSPKE